MKNLQKWSSEMLWKFVKLDFSGSSQFGVSLVEGCTPYASLVTIATITTIATWSAPPSSCSLRFICTLSCTLSFWIAGGKHSLWLKLFTFISSLSSLFYLRLFVFFIVASVQDGIARVNSKAGETQAKTLPKSSDEHRRAGGGQGFCLG